MVMPRVFSRQISNPRAVLQETQGVRGWARSRVDGFIARPAPFFFATTR